MKVLFIEHHKCIGSRTLTALLCKEGYEIGRYRVRKLMKELGLVVQSTCRKVQTTDSRHTCPVAENVLDRQFKPDKRNQVWTTDITYIPTVIGWVYLVVVLDLYSRKVVGWHVSDNMETSLVIRALTMAINLQKPPTRAVAPFRQGESICQQTISAVVGTAWHGLLHEQKRQLLG